MRTVFRCAVELIDADGGVIGAGGEAVGSVGAAPAGEDLAAALAGGARLSIVIEGDGFLYKVTIE